MGWKRRQNKTFRHDISDYEDEGAKMVDIVSFNRALKATWVAKYFDETNKGKWKAIFDYYLSDLEKKYF